MFKFCSLEISWIILKTGKRSNSWRRRMKLKMDQSFPYQWNPLLLVALSWARRLITEQTKEKYVIPFMTGLSPYGWTWYSQWSTAGPDIHNFMRDVQEPPVRGDCFTWILYLVVIIHCIAWLVSFKCQVHHDKYE